MNSGRMVDRRDHVRTTFFSFFSFMSATFFARWSSVNGPFLSDLLIASLLYLSAHDPLVGALVVPRLESTSRLTPGCHRMPAAGRLALTATVRMIDRVHGNAAIVRPLAQPARLTCLSMGLVLVFHVADLADGRHALHLHPSHFAGRQFQQRDSAFARNQLGLRAGRARHLRSLSGPQLDVVNH